MPDSSTEFLDTSDVAARYDVPEATVVDWRYRKTGPAYLKVGNRVRYRVTDLEAWENANVRGGASTSAAGATDVA